LIPSFKEVELLKSQKTCHVYEKDTEVIIVAWIKTDSACYHPLLASPKQGLAKRKILSSESTSILYKSLLLVAMR